MDSILYTYGVASSPQTGDEVLKIETDSSDGTVVDFGFTGLPSTGSNQYTLYVDGEGSQLFNSGGTVSWTHSDWGSPHNFTLRYEQPGIDFQITWSDNSTNEDGFRIYSNASGSFEQVGTVDENIEIFHHTITGLEYGDYTCFHVASYNQFGASDPSTGCITP